MSGTTEWTLPVFDRLFAQAEALGCETVVREYIGVCFDVCHQAVEFEDVADSIEQFVQRGIRINKVHITNAVELLNPSENASGRQALRQFVEPRYLHQTTVGSPGKQSRPTLYEDLPLALTKRKASDKEWRVHFHLPVYLESLGHLSTTQSAIIEFLKAIRPEDEIEHFEVETYAWNVLPPELQVPDLADGIARELMWVREQAENIVR